MKQIPIKKNKTYGEKGGSGFLGQNVTQGCTKDSKTQTMTAQPSNKLPLF